MMACGRWLKVVSIVAEKGAETTAHVAVNKYIIADNNKATSVIAICLCMVAIRSLVVSASGGHGGREWRLAIGRNCGRGEALCVFKEEK